VGTISTTEELKLSTLWHAFRLPHKGTKLTVGGRALTKHLQRDSTFSWGIEIKGTPEQINAKSDFLLQEIFDNVAWFNIY